MKYLTKTFEDFVRNKLNEDMIQVKPVKDNQPKTAERQKPVIYDWQAEFNEIMRECDEMYDKLYR